MMKCASISASNAARASGSVITELLAEGVTREDLDTALALQERQRQCGAPVLSLRTICGRRDGHTPSGFSLSATAAGRLLAAPQPRPRRTGGIHITRRPVWSGSIRTESVAEQEFVRPLSPDERKRISAAGYRTFRRAKQLAAEARAGSRALTEQERKLIGFTSSCRDILVRLLDDAGFRKGWCMPSYETIMRWTGLSRSTVHRSLRILADVGFIEWIRRFIYSRDSEVGARSEQTSNLYRFALPQWLANMIGISSPPAPDDEIQRRAVDQEDTALMLASAGPAEQRRFMPVDEAGRAGLILAALRTALGSVDPRECQNHIPPRNEIHIIGGEKRNRPSRPMLQP